MRDGPRHGRRVAVRRLPPANKTSAAFSKPVDPIVGQLIDAWKLVRPAQPLLVDRRTGGQRVGHSHLNNQITPGAVPQGRHPRDRLPPTTGIGDG